MKEPDLDAQSPDGWLEQYRAAVRDAGLADERAARLVEHAVHRNGVKRSEPPVAPETVRLAAALMAADVSISSPSALAQAIAIGERPGLGPALLDIQRSLLALGLLAGADHDARLERQAVGVILRHLAAEVTRLLERLEREN